MLSLFYGVVALLGGLATAQQTCNNAAALCSKQYNEVTHLGAHDSPFVRDPSNYYSVSGDQFYNSTRQLDSGVRLLSAQVHQDGSSYNLCHTSWCASLFDPPQRTAY